MKAGLLMRRVSLALLGVCGCAAPMRDASPSQPAAVAAEPLGARAEPGHDDCLQPGEDGRGGALARVVAVGHRLMDAPPAGAPAAHDVAFRVVNRQAPNAVTAGNQIVVTCAMLDLLDDDELAFALGHELAHIALGHAAAFVPVDSAPEHPGAAGDASLRQPLATVRRGVSNRYNREQERAADALGLRYAHAAGYRTAAAVTAMRRLARAVPRGVLDEFVDAHPPYPERIAALEALADDLNGSAGPR